MAGPSGLCSGRKQPGQANRFGKQPSIILGTGESLFLRSPGTRETKLPPSEGQTFRYRYRLIHGKNRMFPVTDKWSASNSAIIVPLDGTVRVRFRFGDRPP